MKLVYRATADIIFIFHFAVFLVAVFGWLFPQIWYFYVALLVVTLSSDVFFGYCILSKWEFDLRKKADRRINYHHAWTTYYTHRFTNRWISESFFSKVAILALMGSISLNVYFHYFFIAA